MVFELLDSSVVFTPLMQDGKQVKFGEIAFIVEGRTQTMLQAERIVLNIMQRMSGIATQTNAYVKKLEGTKTKVLDTRKTTPGMRLLDKYAVKTGGGENHRIGLYDMILIKDNHIDFAGSIELALDKTYKYLKENNKDLKVEIEARSLDDVQRILNYGKVDRIMLDNFTPALTKQAVELITGKAEIESSGNITIENIRDYAVCGVDYISVGALTHQIKSLDLSLKAIK
jgi:nicotinate-nucleotide pyrophosphorylase (carboxylating)